jgi:hypothetical protein
MQVRGQPGVGRGLPATSAGHESAMPERGNPDGKLHVNSASIGIEVVPINFEGCAWSHMGKLHCTALAMWSMRLHTCVYVLQSCSVKSATHRPCCTDRFHMQERGAATTASHHRWQQEQGAAHRWWHPSPRLGREAAHQLLERVQRELLTTEPCAHSASSIEWCQGRARHSVPTALGTVLAHEGLVHQGCASERIHGGEHG